MDDWQAEARCRGHEHPEWWFPPEPGVANGREAKAVCVECPVRRDCYEEAVRTGERHGIWGGVSMTSRRRSLRVIPELTHGLRSSYTAGCRCFDCAEAAAEYQRDYYERTRGVA